jgi:protease-4
MKPMSKSKSKWLVWAIVGGAFLIFFALTLYALIVYSIGEDESIDFSFGGSKIAVVDITGTILDAKPVVDQLKKFGDNDSIKAILLRIDSPGGGVAASQEIYSEVLRVRERKNKIVVASMASTGASGAYYIACACNKIVANPGTVTGSIGVIAEWYNYGELVKWAKLKSVVFKSGEFKDAPSPVRELTENERKYLQNLIDDLYSQFAMAVAKGRKMDLAAVKTLADGRVYTGLDAKEKKLIDEIGTFHDAVDMTAKLANISGEPKLVTSPVQRTTWLDLLTGNVSSLLPFTGVIPDSRIQLSYLWK